jgi:hypothetical protein
MGAGSISIEAGCSGDSVAGSSSTSCRSNCATILSPSDRVRKRRGIRPVPRAARKTVPGPPASRESDPLRPQQHPLSQMPTSRLYIEHTAGPKDCISGVNAWRHHSFMLRSSLNSLIRFSLSARPAYIRMTSSAG